MHPLYYFVPAILTYINGACNCRIDDAAAAEYNAGVPAILTYINGACNCRIDDAAAAEYNAGKNTMKGKVMSIIPIFIPHAGCPHQCVFCNQKKISGQKTASAEAVRQQIEKYKSAGKKQHRQRQCGSR